MTAWPGTKDWTTGDTVTELDLDNVSAALEHLFERHDREMTLAAGTDATAGMLVQQDTSAADQVSLVSTANSTARIGVAKGPITAGATGDVRWGGLADVYVGTTAVAVGDYIATSATAGVGAVSTTNPIGRALTSKAGGGGTEGTVVVLLWPRSRNLELSTPLARVYHSANQSVATATWTTLAMDSEVQDTDTLHDPATNNSRLTCVTPGTYVAIGIVNWAASATGRRGARIQQGGATVIESNLIAAAATGNTTVTVLTPPVALTAGQYIELQGFQESGGALNAVASGTEVPAFALWRIGA